MLKRETKALLSLHGLSQLNRNLWVVRVQRTCPITKRKVNRVREIEGSISEAIAKKAKLEYELELELGLAALALPSMGSTPLGSVRSFGRWWLNHKIERGDLEERTQVRYAEALDRLTPEILNTEMEQVSRDQIERWQLLAKRQFAPRTVNGYHRVVKAMFNHPRAREVLRFNPAELVPFLKEPINLEHTNTLSPSQLLRLLRAFEELDPVIANMAWSQGMTGLRFGEVSALTFTDWDLEEQVFEIRRKVGLGGVLIPSTKTNRLRRVGVPPILAEKLMAYRRWLIEIQHPGLESGLMFPSTKGTPIRSSRMSVAMTKARGLAGITQKFTSHGFRRSVTDLLRAAGVDPVIATAIIGHDTSRMRHHYSTVRSAEAVEAAERLQALILGTGKPGGR